MSSDFMVTSHFPGIITLPSLYNVHDTMDRLESILRGKGIQIFIRIDQRAEAKKAGTDMDPLELIIFGNPKGGTPLMVAEPLSGLDLPLKAMAWQDKGGDFWLSYNSFDYLRERYTLDKPLVDAIAGVEALIKQAVS